MHANWPLKHHTNPPEWLDKLQNNISARKNYRIGQVWRQDGRHWTGLYTCIIYDRAYKWCNKESLGFTRIYYLYIPLGPCYSPMRSTTANCDIDDRQMQESYADSSTLNEWIASCTARSGQISKMIFWVGGQRTYATYRTCLWRTWRPYNFDVI